MKSLITGEVEAGVYINPEIINLHKKADAKLSEKNIPWLIGSTIHIHP